MELIIEYYHTGYKPKLDIDKYAYFVDDTNKDIIYKIVEDYLHQIFAVDIQYQLRLFNWNINRGSCLIYFDSDKVSYERHVTSRNIQRTYAAENNYSIIRMVPKSQLMYVE